MIEIQNLTCKFGQKTVLDKLTQTVPSHLSILGANGSGKSTLAKALCGINSYGGSVKLDNKDLQEYEPKERAKTIAYIPTKLEFYDEYLTLEEFVLLGRFPHKESFLDYSQEDRTIASRKMELLGITHLKKHLLNTLSSGESALALIAQALTQESKIITFDEPTANLDPKNAKIVAGHIKNLKQTHQTILITHDISLAHFMNNPVLFLKDKKATHFEQSDFFTDENLSHCYDVPFKSLELCYA